MRTSQYEAPAAVAAASAASARAFFLATSSGTSSASAAMARPNGIISPATPMPDIVRNERLSTFVVPPDEPARHRVDAPGEEDGKARRLCGARSRLVK